MSEKFFAPGRTELAGNHTDHQKGRVLAASVDMGMTALASKNGEGLIRITADGCAPFEIDIFDLEPKPRERGSSAALCRGVCCALDEIGAELGGFDAEISSKLRPGGGLSSSAAFSVLIGRILNGLYNGGTVTPVELAKAGQEAENCHFGKPSGLMDQLACSVGGAVYIDFLSGEIRPLAATFAELGLTLCLLDTGGSHENLTPAYAAIPKDMRYVAGRLGVEYLAEAEPAEFFARHCPEGREREWGRAAHFFAENERVPKMRDALAAGDAAEYMRLMNASGRSSEQQLLNIRAPEGDDALERGLALAASLLEGRGAWRVHGGGFAGCVQALMPTDFYGEYKAKTEAVFGPDSCFELKI
ncbi:MAG: galactokinase family protein [Oscillospiraceae bacterium]